MIPLFVFLIIYVVLLGGIASFFLINITHLVHTGTLTMASFIATFAFLVFVSLILWATWYLLQTIDWQHTVVLWDSRWFETLVSR